VEICSEAFFKMISGTEDPLTGDGFPEGLC
jgi:hypothetical protein